MKDRIGEVAGYVWHYLEDHGETSVTSIVNDVDVPNTKVYMAIGWLTQEGKIEFNDSGRGSSVRLK